ncbi:MAG: hypothetical protein QOF94_990 [Acidobacteriaceae bacterium]
MSAKVQCRIALPLMFLAVLCNASLNLAAQSSDVADARPVEFAMRNVTYHYSEPVAVHIAKLDGELVSTKDGAVVFFDDKNSFTLRLHYAQISISCTALAQVLNENVFSSSDAPIKNLSIESKNNQLIMKGKLPRKADVAFETVGRLSADPDGRIRVHSDHVKAAHLPVKGLMDLLGIDIAGLIDTKKIHGITVEKDDIILDSEQILPAPHIKGKVAAVHISGNDIVLTFGTPQPSNFAAKQPGNYMAFRHSDMRFGKLTMHDADLIMIDMDPRDPFDFYLDHYQDQLVAGYTKSTPQYGLRTYTRDYNKLRSRSAPKAGK